MPPIEAGAPQMSIPQASNAKKPKGFRKNPEILFSQKAHPLFPEIDAGSLSPSRSPIRQL
jgi:hypothetical protein